MCSSLDMVSLRETLRHVLNKKGKCQMCIVGSAPGTPCTMDSSSLRSHRHLGCDATNTTLRERQRAHDDAVTSHAAALSIDRHAFKWSINRHHCSCPPFTSLALTADHPITQHEAFIPRIW